MIGTVLYIDMVSIVQALIRYYSFHINTRPDLDIGIYHLKTQ